MQNFRYVFFAGQNMLTDINKEVLLLCLSSFVLVCLCLKSNLP